MSSTITAPQTEATGAPPRPVLDPEDLPKYDHIVTEDDTPVDNIFSKKQQALFKDPLVNSWTAPSEDDSFLALVNVGLFYAVQSPPLVPDFMLSLGVRAAHDIWRKENRSYFNWVFGKPPDLTAEIISNREGEEGDKKLILYA